MLLEKFKNLFFSTFSISGPEPFILANPSSRYSPIVSFRSSSANSSSKKRPTNSHTSAPSSESIVVSNFDLSILDHTWQCSNNDFLARAITWRVLLLIFVNFINKFFKLNYFCSIISMHEDKEEMTESANNITKIFFSNYQ